MTKIIEAVFDGTAFRPKEPLPLEPNTRVRITIESVQPPTEKTKSFLLVARSLSLDGPPDWAVNLEAYLYGRESPHGG